MSGLGWQCYKVYCGKPGEVTHSRSVGSSARSWHQCEQENLLVACCDQTIWRVQEILLGPCWQDQVGRNLWGRKRRARRYRPYPSNTVSSICRVLSLQCLHFQNDKARNEVQSRVQVYRKDMLVCTCQVPMLANPVSLAVPCQHVYGTDFDHSCTARRVPYT